MGWGYHNTIKDLGDLIVDCFGDEESNVVNFTLLQIILLILARSLHILDRKVKVDLTHLTLSGHQIRQAESTFKISEVKVAAKQPRKSITTAPKKPKGKGTKSKASYQALIPKTLHKLGMFREGKDFQQILDSDRFDQATHISSEDPLLSHLSPNFELKGVGQNADFSPKGFSSMDSLAMHRLVPKDQLLRHSKSMEESSGKIISLYHTSRSKLSCSSKKYESEKLLVVYDRDFTVAPQTLVKKETFKELAEEVKKLENKYTECDLSSEDKLFSSTFCKDAMMTEPVSALQLAARLSKLENKTKKLTVLFKNMLSKTQQQKSQSKAKFGREKPPPVLTTVYMSDDFLTHLKESGMYHSPFNVPTYWTYVVQSVPQEPMIQRAPKVVKSTSRHTTTDSRQKEPQIRNTADHFVSGQDFQSNLDEIKKEVVNVLGNVVTTNKKIIENTSTSTKVLTEKMQKSLQNQAVVDVLEMEVAEFVAKVTNIDSTYTKMLTEYQEQMASMQSEVEQKVDNFNEKVAGFFTDPVALEEVNNKFDGLKHHLDMTDSMQKELKRSEIKLQESVTDITRDVYCVDKDKADRQEVKEAMATKAGLMELNKLLSYEEYIAVQASYQTRIFDIFHMCNKSERNWQARLDDIYRLLDEAADINLLEAFEKHFDEVVNVLDGKLTFMIEICKTVPYTETKAVRRDKLCISCKSKGNTEININKEPKLKNTQLLDESCLILKEEDIENTSIEEKEQKKVKIEKKPQLSPVKEVNIPKPCILHRPIPHPLDPRSQYCQRVCGYAEKNKATELELQNLVKVQHLQKEPVKSILRTCAPCSTKVSKVKTPTISFDPKLKVRESTSKSVPTSNTALWSLTSYRQQLQ